MKRCVILFGGCGGRLAEVLNFAGCAGVLHAPQMQLLLVEPDDGDVHVRRAESLLEDYGRIRRHFTDDERREEFQTELSWSRFPKKMPDTPVRLSDWTGAQEDQLILQALFDEKSASYDLREGFHGDMALAATTFAGYLASATMTGEGALAELVQSIDGEDAQIVLAGSLCGATGSAGIPAVAAYLMRHLGEKAHMSAVLLAAYGAGEDAAVAKSTLQTLVSEGIDMPVCLIGLPEGARLTELTDAGRLPEWLAVHAIDWFLRHDASDHAAYTYRAPEGPLTWDIFGRDADLYRSGYVRLMKTALLFRLELTEEMAARIEKPNALRDRLGGWYAACCRSVLKMSETERQEILEDLPVLTRLMEGAWAWMEQVVGTQPQEMCHATAVMAARRASRENYQALVETAAQLTVLTREAEETGLKDDTIVHRGHTEEEDDADRLRQHLENMQEQLDHLIDGQHRLFKRTGGSASMRLLYDMLEKCQTEAADLRAQYEEAVRRIDESEKIAQPHEQYKILAARTKLKRMERHLAMLDERTRRVLKDLANAKKTGLRWQSPEIIGADERPECGIFDPSLLGVLRPMQQVTDKKALRQHQEIAEDAFPVLTEGDGVTVKRALQTLSRVKIQDSDPLACLFEQAMNAVLEEVE